MGEEIEGTRMARRRAFAIASPRFATGLFRKIILVVVTLVVVCGIVLVGAAAFFTYRVSTEHNDTENVTPDTFLVVNYEPLSFTTRDGGEHEGWLLRGHRGGPVIIMCHGYDSNRSELLWLATGLQEEDHFNVYLFNFRGPKSRQRSTDLGLHQVEELEAAVEMVTKRPEINPKLLGLFGMTTGAYAALVVAERNPRVKALVVDSVYEKPDQMFDSQFDQLLGGGSSAFFRILGETEFHLFNLGMKPFPVRKNLSRLQGMAKLFIVSRDAPTLAAVTEDLYKDAPQSKQMLTLVHSQTGLASGAEKKEYRNQVVTFFAQNLPIHVD